MGCTLYSMIVAHLKQGSIVWISVKKTGKQNKGEKISYRILLMEVIKIDKHLK